MKKLDSFKPQELASTLWVYVEAGVEHEALLKEIALKFKNYAEMDLIDLDFNQLLDAYVASPFLQTQDEFFNDIIKIHRKVLAKHRTLCVQYINEKKGTKSAQL
mmetsp:Transcript_11256/g.15460  ORF Transcript_11256/g.15460 Transcript_11256/m.15460 type:complete len:104 (-) Transcript_11256:217-528(-)